VSSRESDVVADTVVVNYFVSVGAFDLLADILGGVVAVPRAVFDPDEPNDVADAAVSELRAGLRLHRRRAGDERIPAVLRQRSDRALPHLETLPALAASGRLVALELSDNELRLFAELRSVDYVQQFARVAGLGRGEAAALAIALTRGYRLATDDQDAIEVARAIDPDLPIHRIRALLLRAVERKLVIRSEAEALHEAMIDAGFWDERGSLLRGA
jgi:predicted nucleic acid-binding protein